MSNNRRWIGLALIGVLVVLALASIVVILLGAQPASQSTTGLAQVPVVVALRPIEAGQVLTGEDVGVQLRDTQSTPSGAVTHLQDAMGQIVGRTLGEGDVLLVPDLMTLAALDQSETAGPLDSVLGSDWVAVALQAPDLWSQWGGIQAGDHVDVLAATEIALESDLPSVMPASVPTETSALQVAMQEQVLMWTIQDLEVLQVVEEPMDQAVEEGTESSLPIIPARRLLLILKATPQDAAILHFLQHADASLDLAVRANQNDRQFDVDAVTQDYLLRRYSPHLERARFYPQELVQP